MTLTDSQMAKLAEMCGWGKPYNARQKNAGGEYVAQWKPEPNYDDWHLTLAGERVVIEKLRLAVLPCDDNKWICNRFYATVGEHCDTFSEAIHAALMEVLS